MQPMPASFMRFSVCAFAAACLLAGCGQQGPAPKAAAEAEAKPATPAVPPELADVAQTLLGSETDVLVFGDLAKNGKQQILAVNRVRKTPEGVAPGTLVTRAVVAENENGKWTELLRCDEYLKNPKGYLALTPLDPVTGWRLQYEQDGAKGLVLYFTPLQMKGATHIQPIGVRWNPATKRYQSLDRSFENFLLEVPSLENARATLR